MDLVMVKNQIDRVINYWFTALHPKWTCRPNEIMLSYGNGEDLRSCVSVGSNGNFLIWTIVGRVRVTSAVQKNIDMFNATEKTLQIKAVNYGTEYYLAFYVHKTITDESTVADEISKFSNNMEYIMYFSQSTSARYYHELKNILF